VPDDRKPRVPRLSNEVRDESPHKTPPAGVQAAIERGAPLHELAAPHEVPEGDDLTDAHPLMTPEERAPLELASIRRRLKRVSVVETKVNTLATDVAGLAGQNKTLIAMNERQLDVLGDIARKRADTYDELAKVSATSRWRIAVIVATGLFGTGGILAILAVAITKGC